MAAKGFDCVITDLQHPDDGGAINKTAGIDLVSRARQSGSQTRIVIYCTPDEVARYADTATKAGANAVTSSPVDLLRSLVLV
jgi:CheY-like chemotaxis protein